MNRTNKYVAIPAASLIGLFLTSAVVADLAEAPVINMSMSGGHGSGWWGYDFNTSNYGNVDGNGNIFNYVGETFWNECDVSWWHELEVDPGLGFGFNVTNNLSVTETFTLSTEVLVPGWNNGTLLGASISGSLTDTNFNGDAQLSGSQDGLLSAYLDETQQLLLGQDVSANVDIIAGSTAFGPYMAGLGTSGPFLDGPLSTDGLLRIDISFTLSPGDTVTFTGAYVVAYVPGPGGLLIFAGLLATKRRRRH